MKIETITKLKINFSNKNSIINQFIMNYMINPPNQDSKSFQLTSQSSFQPVTTDFKFQFNKSSTSHSKCFCQKSTDYDDPIGPQQLDITSSDLPKISAMKEHILNLEAPTIYRKASEGIQGGDQLILEIQRSQMELEKKMLKWMHENQKLVEKLNELSSTNIGSSNSIQFDKNHIHHRNNTSFINSGDSKFEGLELTIAQPERIVKRPIVQKLIQDKNQNLTDLQNMLLTNQNGANAERRKRAQQVDFSQCQNCIALKLNNEELIDQLKLNNQELMEQLQKKQIAIDELEQTLNELQNNRNFRSSNDLEKEEHFSAKQTKNSISSFNSMGNKLNRKSIMGAFNKMTTLGVGVMSNFKDYNSFKAMSNNAVFILNNAKIDLYQQDNKANF